MTVITITRKAKCKDCKFLKVNYLGKRKYHVCDNLKSTFYDDVVRLNDLACENWEL